MQIILRTGAQLTWPQILCALTAPISMFKQAINIIRIKKAAQALAQSDFVARSKAQHAAEATQQ